MGKRVVRNVEGGRKGIMKVFFVGSAILKEWGIVSELKGYM